MKAGGEGMADFVREIEVVQGEVKTIKLLLKLHSANEESKGVHRAEALKALRAGTALDRLRMSLTENQRKKLKEVMDDFQALRGKMVDEEKETMERRYYNGTGKHADEVTIENMIRTCESETFLQEAIRSEQGHGHVIETVREIQERHDGLRAIEKQLQELQAIFMDMAVLVNAQSHLINDMEANVNCPPFFRKNSDIARRLQPSTRQWTFFVLHTIISLVVLLVILKSTQVI